MTESVSAAPKGGAVVLVDLNSLGFQVQLGGSRLSAGAVETTGIYGFLRSLRLIREEVAGRIICLHDGRSWRYDLFEGYKANRKSDPKILEARERWAASKPWVVKMLRSLGIDQLLASNLEADDLAARLRRYHEDHGRDVVLVSSDHDWLQLIGPRTSVLDWRKQRRVHEGNFVEQVGLPSPMAVAEAKALMGDVSDCIPGVGGIGAKTVEELLNEHGSVTGFINTMLGEPERRAVANKRALKLLDEDRRLAFDYNMRLIWLDHPRSPPAQKPNLVAGKFDLDAFTRMAEELAFTSILRDLTRWVAPFAEGNTYAN